MVGLDDVVDDILGATAAEDDRTDASAEDGGALRAVGVTMGGILRMPVWGSYDFKKNNRLSFNSREFKYFQEPGLNFGKNRRSSEVRTRERAT